MMVLLARHLGPKGFGVFVLAFTVLIFVNSIQSALFTQPHNVLGATRTGPQYAEYTSATFISQVVVSLASGLLIAATGGVMHVISGMHAPLLLGVALASVTWQIQEYCRRVFYTQGDYFSAFSNDLVTYGGQASGILALWQLDRLTSVGALLSIGIASLLGSAFGVIRLRSVLFYGQSRSNFQDILTENWEFGKWLLGSAIAKWASSQLYPVLAASFVGVAATGGLRATQNIVAPTNIIVKTFESISPPGAARAYRDGGFASMARSLIRLGGPLGAVLILYFGTVSLAAIYLVPWLMGSAYSAYSWLVWIYSVSYLVGYINLCLSVALRSTSQTVPMFVANVVSAAFTLTVGIAIVRKWELTGVAIGMIAHGFILLAILAVFTIKTRNKLNHSDINSFG